MIVGFPYSVYTWHNAIEVLRNMTGMSDDEATETLRSLTQFGWANRSHKAQMDTALYIASDIQDAIDEYNAPFSVFMRDMKRRLTSHAHCDCTAMQIVYSDLEALLQQYVVTLTPR
jgi:hypothetical protein